jgi:cobalt-zinc-cadmium efflux system outer membrane protein
MSYRLGVQRARADASVARAEAFPDIFVLYTPFGHRNNSPTGGQDATSWGLGVFASVPLFNRNQGNIQRAAINVSQTSIETAGIERQIQTEVLQAVKNYSTALGTVAKLEHDVVPRARDVRNMTLNLFRSGEEGAVGYLNAQREYSEVIRQYRDALIRLRRAALNLNTVVALRITR